MERKGLKRPASAGTFSRSRPPGRARNATSGASMKQGIFTITGHEALTKDVYRMALAGDTSAMSAPGQFVEISLPGFFLRRPISVCD